MNRGERAETIIAMERLARAVNDEEVFDLWLGIGIPDGEIDLDSDYSQTANQIGSDDYWMDDDNFADLMDTFLVIMKGAKKSGGLYVDGVVSSRREYGH